MRASASASPMSASAFLPLAQAVGALEGPQRERVLLQHQVGARRASASRRGSSGPARAGAPGARPWSAGSPPRCRACQLPVAPGDVQQRGAEHQQAPRAEGRPGAGAAQPCPRRSSGTATGDDTRHGEGGHQQYEGDHQAPQVLIERRPGPGRAAACAGARCASHQGAEQQQHRRRASHSQAVRRDEARAGTG